jgi:ankyrin repeat protein
MSSEINITIHAQKGRTAIFAAAQNGHVECLKELLLPDRGALVDQVDQVRGSVAAAAAAACMLSTNPRLWMQEGQTALFGAAFCGKLECLKMLLDKGAAVNHKKAKVRLRCA